MKNKTILGSWCTELSCKFIDSTHIQTELVAHVWYAYDNDSKTDVINKKLCFVKEIDFSELNDEVEIIEENNKINKIKINYNSINIDKVFENGTTTFFREKDIEIFQCLSSKINELIDEVNKLKEKE